MLEDYRLKEQSGLDMEKAIEAHVRSAPGRNVERLLRPAIEPKAYCTSQQTPDWRRSPTHILDIDNLVCHRAELSRSFAAGRIIT